MRITRHPQSFGQALWCLAHTLWIGSTFMVATTGMCLIMLNPCWYRVRSQASSWIASLVLPCSSDNHWCIFCHMSGLMQEL